MKTIPNPGSYQAVAEGCMCPVMDNSYGKGSGYTDLKGNPTFWITKGCKSHDKDLKDALRESKRNRYC